MRILVDLIGFASTLSGGIKQAEISLPDGQAVVGDVYRQMGTRFGENFRQMTYDDQTREIKLLTMLNGIPCAYDTPVADGAHLQVTMHMDGG